MKPNHSKRNWKEIKMVLMRLLLAWKWWTWSNQVSWIFKYQNAHWKRYTDSMSTVNALKIINYVGTILNIRVRLIERLNFPLIFNCSDTVRTFRNIENNFFFVRGSANKIKNCSAAWTLHSMTSCCFCTAIRTKIT